MEIGAHWTVAVIVGLVSWALSASVLPEVAPDHGSVAYVVAGACAALGLIVSILLHELSHALVARHDGVPVTRITIWMLGGVAQLGGHARSSSSELRIAIAGPLTSLALGSASFIVVVIIGLFGANDLVVATFGWLAVVNVALAVFNMLPGAPLDGGRVVAALLWRRTGNEQFARFRSAQAGAVLGQTLIALGIVLLALGRGDGLWLALVGWFVTSSARAEQNAAQMSGALGDLRVGDVMTPDPETVDGSMTVADFVAHAVTGTRGATFPLVDAFGSPTGVVTLRQIRRLPRPDWTTTMAAAGTPAEEMTVARVDDRLVDVLATTTSEDGRILVTDRLGRLVGLVTPSDVTSAFDRRLIARGPDSWTSRIP